MDKKCQDEIEPLSLQDILRVALSSEGPLTELNITFLYSIIKSILKKLNCEDEVVTVYGVKSLELQELLSKANDCALPCDDHIEVITEKLKTIEKLERKISKMETKLEKHLDIKFESEDRENIDPKRSINYVIPQEEKDLKKVFQFAEQPKRIKSVAYSFDGYYERDNKSILSELKRTRSVTSVFSNLAFLRVNPNKISNEVEYEKTLANDAECLTEKVQILKETFSQFKKRIEDDDNWYEMPKKCGPPESDSMISEVTNTSTENTIEEELKIEEELVETESLATEESKETEERCSCYKPCEDIFTIPDPENKLPRFLYRNRQFFDYVTEISLAPFKRRLRSMEGRIAILISNLYNWIVEVRERTMNISVYEMVIDSIADLSYMITSNQIVVKKTLAGMQEIFDLKINNYEILPIKKEIHELLERGEKIVCETRDQFALLKVAAFTYQNDEEKKQSELKKKIYKSTYEQNCNCNCGFICSEPKLIHRIERLTWDDLSFMRDRQTMSCKQIRLTGNSANYVCSLQVKRPSEIKWK